MATTKNPLKELNEWLNAYTKVNGEPTCKEIKKKIQEMIKEGRGETPVKSQQIFFRDCIYSEYSTLRDKLMTDKKFVENYKGVDLKAYIEQALAWSEKNNKTTELGWLLTIKNWIRNAKREGKMIMKPVTVKKGFTNI